MSRRTDTKRHVEPAYLALALLGVLGLVLAWLWRRHRRRQAPVVAIPTRASRPARMQAASPVDRVPARVTQPPRSIRRRLGLSLVALAALSMGASLLSGAASTFALLTDQVTMSQIDVTAGTVNAPTGMTLTETGSAVRVGWTAPSTGLTPQDYEVFRSSTSGSYGAVTATDAASPWDDTSAAQCATSFYKVRSSHTNLKSGFTAEQSIYVDRNAPVVSDARVVFAGVSPKVPDFVRATGGTVEVYANVTDNCDPASSLNVTFNLANLGGISAQSTTIGTWQPVVPGPTYNRMYTYTMPTGTVPDAATRTWSITAADSNGNIASLVPGTPVTGDGSPPSLNRAEAVSAVTNYYDPTFATGEINSNDLSVTAAVRNAGFYVYGDFSDASGVASMTSNVAVALNVIKAGGTAEVMTNTAAPYATDNGISWGWRSAAIVPTADLTDATDYNFTVTATDRLGNTATTPNQAVYVDDTLPTAPTCLNGGGANDNAITTGEWTNLAFTDTLDPNSIRAGWDGSALIGTAILRNNASADFFDFNTDFGVTFLAGTTAATAFDLSVNSVAADVPFANSTFERLTRNSIRVTYNTGTAPAGNGNASITIGTSLREASGNQPAADVGVTCSRNPW